MLKRKLSQPDSEDHDDNDGDGTPTLFRSDAIEDRQSTFIAVYSPSLQPKELQALAEFQTADHKILGWRRESNQQSIGKSKLYVTGSDDDGEKYAGKKVEKVLEACQATGAVVVARWWGGVMLGPVRFTHIEQAARASIRAWETHQAEARTKRRRLADEKEEQERLAKSLGARDESIAVLRTLATDKEQQLKAARDGGISVTSTDEILQAPAVPAPTTQVPIEYTTLPVERLRALDKARDATLSFLLKRIDKAEAEFKKLKSEVADKTLQ